MYILYGFFTEKFITAQENFFIDRCSAKTRVEEQDEKFRLNQFGGRIQAIYPCDLYDHYGRRYDGEQRWIQGRLQCVRLRRY